MGIVARAALTLFPSCESSTEVRGLERLETLDGPAVLVANHPGHLDPVVLARALPPCLRRRLAVAAAEDTLYQGANRLTGLLASLLLGAFPIPRHGRADEALRRARATAAHPAPRGR